MARFNATDRAFLLKEFGLGVEDLTKMNYKELTDLRDACFEVEYVETYDAGEGDLSERGETAVRLVDLLLEVKRGLRFAGKELTA